MNQRQEWNQAVVAEFRANDGVVGGDFAGTPLVLLTTIGARTRELRVTPLAYVADGDRLVVFGANGGRPTQPAWVHNIRANPRVGVEVGADTYPAKAVEATGAERDRLWRLGVDGLPMLTGFAEATGREIPVVVLDTP